MSPMSTQMPNSISNQNKHHLSCQKPAPYSLRGGEGRDLSEPSLPKGGNRGIRVLGIDPGFGRTGLGVIALKGSKFTHIWHSCIDTPADAPFTERLQSVRNDIVEAVRRFKPDVAAVEHLFFQSNVKTAIKVGMARGVILLVLADAKLPVAELTPNEIKQVVAGHGSAGKNQVQQMVARLLKLKDLPKPDDAADALAIAIAGGLTHQTRAKLSNSSFSIKS